jgi:hypothetical protein
VTQLAAVEIIDLSLDFRIYGLRLFSGFAPLQESRFFIVLFIFPL